MSPEESLWCCLCAIIVIQLIWGGGGERRERPGGGRAWHRHTTTHQADQTSEDQEAGLVLEKCVIMILYWWCVVLLQYLLVLECVVSVSVVCGAGCAGLGRADRAVLGGAGGLTESRISLTGYHPTVSPCLSSHHFLYCSPLLTPRRLSPDTAVPSLC